ncbi:PREDICTED: sodium channel modifier 1-like, partial [Acanthisitta chloris]|uniref:sodium channel modifier 1-like n=1 Tax=Acanthisitta chloris TaxID=57068 RepID=UPI0004F0FF06
KRRVADLLANCIPEDEALLLRSGRFACSVCPHRPIFDTLDILAVHRAGKKHAASLQRFYSQNRSLQAVAPVRQQEEEVQGEDPSVQGSPAPLLARTRRIARSALLKSAPYSSCCRRTGVKGSSSRTGISRTGPSATGMLPKPFWSVGEAMATSPVAPLPEHLHGQADTPNIAPVWKGKASLMAPSQHEGPSLERLQVLRHYLRLRSSGWIQDPSGKWVKDENAEFDSDEDEPPVRLPA